MTQNLNSVFDRRISGVTKGSDSVVVTAQALTDTYVDFGSNINVKNNRYLGLWVEYDVNDSDAVDLKILGRKIDGGDDFEIDGLSEKRVYNTGDVDGKVYYEFDTGTLSYIQIQAKAGTVGAIAGTLTISQNVGG